MGDIPETIVSNLLKSTSMPLTFQPALAAAIASGRPT
jgi:hypothetical protein